MDWNVTPLQPLGARVEGVDLRGLVGVGGTWGVRAGTPQEPRREKFLGYQAEML